MPNLPDLTLEDYLKRAHEIERLQRELAETKQQVENWEEAFKNVTKLAAEKESALQSAQEEIDHLKCPAYTCFYQRELESAQQRIAELESLPQTSKEEK